MYVQLLFMIAFPTHWLVWMFVWRPQSMLGRPEPSGMSLWSFEYYLAMFYAVFSNRHEWPILRHERPSLFTHTISYSCLPRKTYFCERLYEHSYPQVNLGFRFLSLHIHGVLEAWTFTLRKVLSRLRIFILNVNGQSIHN